LIDLASYKIVEVEISALTFTFDHAIFDQSEFYFKFELHGLSDNLIYWSYGLILNFDLSNQSSYRFVNLIDPNWNYLRFNFIHWFRHNSRYMIYLHKGWISKEDQLSALQFLSAIYSCSLYFSLIWAADIGMVHQVHFDLIHLLQVIT